MHPVESSNRTKRPGGADIASIAAHDQRRAVALTVKVSADEVFGGVGAVVEDNDARTRHRRPQSPTCGVDGAECAKNRAGLVAGRDDNRDMVDVAPGRRHRTGHVDGTTKIRRHHIGSTRSVAQRFDAVVFPVRRTFKHCRSTRSKRGVCA